MHFFAAHKVWTGILALLVVLAAVIVWQVLYIKFNGTSVPVPNIPRTTEHFGSAGTPLSYVVIGDSTAVAQGAQYEQGVARGTAEYLARNHQVSLTNYGISGARVADVLHDQVAKAAALKPDVVLLCIGANDVTHLTNVKSVEDNMTSIIAQLQAANPKVQIVLTGSPAMGSVQRFAPPTKWLASLEVRRINGVIQKVAARKHAIFVPLAIKTAAAFMDHPERFAADKFHPNAAGYAIWLPVIEDSFQQLQLP